MPYRWLLIFWCFAGLTSEPLVAHAQQQADHLHPMTGYFNATSPAYYAKVRETLFAEFATAPLLGAVVCPSFEPEYALFVTQKPGKHMLTHRNCQTNIWYAGHFAYAKPRKSHPVAVTTKTVEVNQVLVAALRHAFGAAIAQTRYPEPAYSLRSDGTTYTFVAFIEGVGTAGGQTWSPSAGTNMGALVDLVANLKKLVDAPTEQAQTALMQQAQQLVKRFADKKE